MGESYDFKESALKKEPKSMYMAVRVGMGPVKVYPTIQYLDTKERVWQTKESNLSPAARCAIGFTEESARGLLTWGPFQGSANGRPPDFESGNVSSSLAP